MAFKLPAKLHKYSLITEFAVGPDERLVQTGIIRNTCNLRSVIGAVNTFMFQRDEYMPSVAKVNCGIYFVLQLLKICKI